MGVSLRIDNDDVPMGERPGIEREYEEKSRLQSMHGIAYEDTAIETYERLPIRNKGNSDFL